MEDNQGWKKIWKNAAELEEHTELSEAKLNAITKKKSVGIVEKLKSTLVFELWFNVIFTILISGILIFQNKWFWFTSFGLLMVASIFYYINFIKKIKEASTETSVLSHLKKVRNLLKEFVKHYKITSFVIVPFGFVLGLSLFQTGIIKDILHNTILFSITAGALVLAFLIAGWIIKIMYGNKVKALTQIIKEYESEERD